MNAAVSDCFVNAFFVERLGQLVADADKCLRQTRPADNMVDLEVLDDPFGSPIARIRLSFQPDRTVSIRTEKRAGDHYVVVFSERMFAGGALHEEARRLPAFVDAAVGPYGD